ncbi:Fe-S cluster assembly protein IscX [Gammaproteobacteria bacterium]|nr:Fe-S cluster assembly protein IscX [Gammaproteobacteria bacterium]
MKWIDIYDIAIELADACPGLDPYSVSFTSLHEYVCNLDNFSDKPDKSSEKILEAIQAAWADEIN